MVDLPANALASILLALNDGLMLHRTLGESGFRWANISRALDALLAGSRRRERGIPLAVDRVARLRER